MSNDTLGMILTAIWGLLGILFGGTGLIIIRSIFKALAESTDVGTALDTLMETVNQAEKDGVWEGGELDAIKKTADNVKLQIIEAKDAWQKVQSVLIKRK